MILLDYNGIGISSLMRQLAADKSIQVDENLFRHIFLSQILYYRKRFHTKFGEIVICTDDGMRYWRRTAYKHYKSGRKKKRDDSKYDWPQIWHSMEQVKNELRETFPYKVITATGAEADDIIAVLCREEAKKNGTGEKILIVSSDKDFLQLQRYQNVHQYSPKNKEFIKEADPIAYLKHHILNGDSSDGIPNFLSPDDVFSAGTRQASLYKESAKEWVKQEPEQFCNEEQLKNYRRNELLIDFDKIPPEVEQEIITAFTECKVGHRSKLLSYMIKHKLKNLMSDIGDF